MMRRESGKRWQGDGAGRPASLGQQVDMVQSGRTWGYLGDLEEARFPGGHLRGAGRSALGGWFWTRGRVPQLLGSRGGAAGRWLGEG